VGSAMIRKQGNLLRNLGKGGEIGKRDGKERKGRDSEDASKTQHELQVVGGLILTLGDDVVSRADASMNSAEPYTRRLLAPPTRNGCGYSSSLLGSAGVLTDLSCYYLYVRSTSCLPSSSSLPRSHR
jgi:hypothetical protein